MRWLLDTNVLIDAFAGRPDAVRAIKEASAKDAEWVGYSAITRLEILGYSRLRAEDEKKLEQLLGEFSEAHITPAVIDRAIQIRKSARIKIPDALIAATALVYQADLITRNRTDFSGIYGLTVVNPAAL